MTTVAIVDYKVGNIFSMTTALQRVAFNVEVTADPILLRAADAIVLPGVGNWKIASDHIQSLKPLIREIVAEGKPFLGSCLGVQIMLEHSDEGAGEGIGLIKGRVRKFSSIVKIPHMGWNTLNNVKPVQLLDRVTDDMYFYFVHSYYPEPLDSTVTAAKTTYGIDFTSVISNGNVCGTQFHPEKSGKAGSLILENFKRMVKR